MQPSNDKYKEYDYDDGSRLDKFENFLFTMSIMAKIILMMQNSVDKTGGCLLFKAVSKAISNSKSLQN